VASRGTSPDRSRRGGEVDGDDVQPVVEILAELAFGGHVGEVPVGGGHEPDVDLALLGVAHLLHPLRLQHAEQLPLRLHAEVGDLVEKEGSLVGDLEEPLLGGDGAGEGALDVAEQLAFQERGRQGRAIAGQQGVILAAAEPVDRADDHLLARPALAGYQHGPVGGADAFDQGEDAFHGSAFADDALEPAMHLQLAAEAGVFADQGGPLADLLQDQLQLAGREGFAQIVGGPLLHRLDGRLHGRMAGDDHDLAGDAGRLHGVEDLQAVHAGHLQIDQEDVVIAGERRLKARARLFRAGHLVPFGTERPLTAQPDDGLVVDHQNPLPERPGFFFPFRFTHRFTLKRKSAGAGSARPQPLTVFALRFPRARLRPAPTHTGQPTISAQWGGFRKGYPPPLPGGSPSREPIATRHGVLVGLPAAGP